jgi:hypothetical protein
MEKYTFERLYIGETPILLARSHVDLLALCGRYVDAKPAPISGLKPNNRNFPGQIILTNIKINMAGKFKGREFSSLDNIPPLEFSNLANISSPPPLLIFSLFSRVANFLA